MWKKLSSRKLWLALAGVFTGIALILGADAEEIQTVAGAITSLISVVTYIVVEGKIDAEGVKGTILELQEVTDLFEDEEDA
ncbi:MAG: hypothetical protein IJZ25_00815 [Lachnospiraceae bacterium]|nr:hypothetical protein [Lachnospiraceae bacterium]